MYVHQRSADMTSKKLSLSDFELYILTFLGILNSNHVQWRLNLRLHKVHLMCTWGARHL